MQVALPSANLRISGWFWGLRLDAQSAYRGGVPPRGCAALMRRGVLLTTFEQMVRIQLERLLPALFPHQWLEYVALLRCDEFGFQPKLKRGADVAVAVVLHGR